MAFDLSLEHLNLTSEKISFEQENRDISSNLDRQEWLKEYRSEHSLLKMELVGSHQLTVSLKGLYA